MNYDVWQTCLLYPGLTRAECASWVQAWGSVLAIIWGVFLYRNEVRKRRREVVEGRTRRLKMILHGLRDMEKAETEVLTNTDDTLLASDARGVALRRWMSGRSVLEAMPLASTEHPAEYDILGEYHDSFGAAHVDFDYLRDRHAPDRPAPKLDEAIRGVERHRETLGRLIERTGQAIADLT